MPFHQPTASFFPKRVVRWNWFARIQPLQRQIFQFLLCGFIFTCNALNVLFDRDTFNLGALAKLSLKLGLNGNAHMALMQF